MCIFIDTYIDVADWLGDCSTGSPDSGLEASGGWAKLDRSRPGAVKDPCPKARWPSLRLRSMMCYELQIGAIYAAYT